MTILPRFANQDLLNDHFLDHGSDFGARSETDYEMQAGNFLTDRSNLDILERSNYSGDLIRFNPRTNEFGILSPSGQIRTCYILERANQKFPSNMDYFNDQ